MKTRIRDWRFRDEGVVYDLYETGLLYVLMTSHERHEQDNDNFDWYKKYADPEFWK